MEPATGPWVPRRWVRLSFLIATWVYIAALLFQVYLAGVGIFQTNNFGTHAEFGYTAIHLLALILLALAFFLRAGKTMPILAGANFVIAFLMPQLATLRADAPAVAALHPVAAVIMVGLTIYIAIRAHALVPAPFGTAVPMVPPVGD